LLSLFDALNRTLEPFGRPSDFFKTILSIQQLFGFVFALITVL